MLYDWWNVCSLHSSAVTSNVACLGLVTTASSHCEKIGFAYVWLWTCSCLMWTYRTKIGAPCHLVCGRLLIGSRFRNRASTVQWTLGKTWRSSARDHWTGTLQLDTCFETSDSSLDTWTCGLPLHLLLPCHFHNTSRSCLQLHTFEIWSTTSSFWKMLEPPSLGPPFPSSRWWLAVVKNAQVHVGPLRDWRAKQDVALPPAFV